MSPIVTSHPSPRAGTRGSRARRSISKSRWTCRALRSGVGPRFCAGTGVHAHAKATATSDSTARRCPGAHRRPTLDRDGRASKRPARGLAARGGMPPRYPRLASGAMAPDHDQWTVADTASRKSGRVQVFPNRESVLALYGEVLLDIDPPQRGPVVERGTHSRRQDAPDTFDLC